MTKRGLAIVAFLSLLIGVTIAFNYPPAQAADSRSRVRLLDTVYEFSATGNTDIFTAVKPSTDHSLLRIMIATDTTGTVNLEVDNGSTESDFTLNQDNDLVADGLYIFDVPMPRKDQSDNDLDYTVEVENSGTVFCAIYEVVR